MGKRRTFVIRAIDNTGKEIAYRELEYRLVRGLDRLGKRKDIDLTTIRIYEIIPDGEGGEFFVLVHGEEND
jgi:hypothetical protein